MANEIMQLQALYLHRTGRSNISAVASIPNVRAKAPLNRVMKFRVVRTMNDERVRFQALGFQVSDYLITDGQFKGNILLQQQNGNLIAQLPNQVINLRSVTHRFENILKRFSEHFVVDINGEIIDSAGVKVNYGAPIFANVAPQLDDIAKKNFRDIMEFL
jgi:hypothetical protein